MNAMLVPHADDEIIFMYSLLEEVEAIGFLTNMGYDRHYECRAHLGERYPHLRLKFYDLYAPTDESPDRYAFTPIDSSALHEACTSFIKEYNVTQLFIPGGTDEYPHTHHAQLERWCGPLFRIRPETRLKLSHRNKWRKRDLLHCVYPCASPGFVTGYVSEILDQGEDIFQVYRIR